MATALLSVLLITLGVLADGYSFAENKALEERIDRLEKRDETLMAIIEQQQAVIENLQKKHDILKKRNEENGKIILNQQTELENIKALLQSNSHDKVETRTEPTVEASTFITKNTSAVSSFPSIKKHKTSIKENQIKKEKRFLTTDAETVAFHATFAEHKTITNIHVGSPIAFPSVEMNIGNAFHSSTSLFIAPKAGIYIFSSSIMSFWSGNHAIHAGIMKNGNYLAGAFATDNNGGAEQGSVTVATQLNVGDEVWVKHIVHENASLYGEKLTSFMGCLVTPL